MASLFYKRLLPDYGDLDNRTGDAPGWRFYILENDGGVAFEIMHPDENPTNGKVHAAVFLNVEEAEELVADLQKAINRAKPKAAPHKRRARNC